MLTDGRSPAPRVVGDLLVNLRSAGAASIAAPVCASCGKQLRMLQRRGTDWYCAVCSPRATGCAACGKNRIVATSTARAGLAVRAAPDVDCRDMLLTLITVITPLEPSLAVEDITTAIGRVFSRPSHLQRLAWAIESRSELLTGQGAQAPMHGVLQLIDELREAGAQAITRPACPRCQRIIRLHRRINGQWHCRNCLSKSRPKPGRAAASSAKRPPGTNTVGRCVPTACVDDD